MLPSISSSIPRLGLAFLLQGVLYQDARPLASASPLQDASQTPVDTHITKHLEGSYWYDWGWYGAYPRASYESFGATSPRPNLLQTDDRCTDDLIFIEPRGIYVETPGPIILDNQGNLVWTSPEWGQAMDVKVQQFQGKDHITFWHGSDNGTFGEGYYLMLDETYQVVKKVTPVGDLTGDLHEFLITDNDTALMTIYKQTETDMSDYGLASGWIYDSIFQEVDLDTGDLIFEWRASDHFPISASMAPLGGQGTSASKAFDFFHINSIDKDARGDYMVSSRYLCAVIGVDGVSGEVIWHLGGDGNDFEDLSDGRATDFSWNHHASWDKRSNDSTVLTIFDNGSNGKQTNTDHSSGLMIELDIPARSAKLLHSFVAPQKLLAPSQGSVQVLSNNNVLVGWGHTPAWTEFSVADDGSEQVLCDTHIGPIWWANFSWVKNYRTFKYRWTGRPARGPDAAMRPGESAVYVSWNGATEVAQWQLESADDEASSASDDGFQRHGAAVRKTTFETRIAVPPEAGSYIRVSALDADGAVLGRTAAVAKTERTVTPLLHAPSRSTPPSVTTIFLLSCLGAVLVFGVVHRFRAPILRGARKLLPRGLPSLGKYEKLPSN